ncbi:MAG: outer membrane beta-barrel protein [Bacteroidales bacterium]|jgi:hypothetical protein|nr:outer membrane beta-barrel protein [Bacteroidales bacterium]
MMKRFLFFLVLFLMIFSMQISAQVIQGALIGGLNASQVDGDEIYGFDRYGGVIGAAAIIPFDRNWSVSLETLFSQKGSYQSAFYTAIYKDSITGVETILTGEYDLRLNYVEVPLMVHYTDRERITVGTGFSYARMVGVTEKEHGNLINTTTTNSGTYNKSDFLVHADIRFRLYENLKLNFRYSYSILKIRTREFTNLSGSNSWIRDQRNNVFAIRLIWVFNEKAKTLDEVK